MSAGPALAQYTGTRNPGATDLRFEGVWAKPGSVTLIKQFPKHLVLQGKDEASVWSARCVLGGGKPICRRHGFTITGYDFAYEPQTTPPLVCSGAPHCPPATFRDALTPTRRARHWHSAAHDAFSAHP